MGSAVITNLAAGKDRFTVEKFFKAKDTWYCGLGFYFDQAELNYPTLRLHFGASTSLKIKQLEIFDFMTDISRRNGWQSMDYADWFTAYHPKNLVHFLSGEDHVALMKIFLLERLDELADLKQSYPQLPW